MAAIIPDRISGCQHPEEETRLSFLEIPQHISYLVSLAKKMVDPGAVHSLPNQPVVGKQEYDD